jgi:hypothetical protein
MAKTEFRAITLAFRAIFRDLLDSPWAGNWTGCPALWAAGQLIGVALGSREALLPGQKRWASGDLHAHTHCVLEVRALGLTLCEWELESIRDKRRGFKRGLRSADSVDSLHVIEVLIEIHRSQLSVRDAASFRLQQLH